LKNVKTQYGGPFPAVLRCSSLKYTKYVCAVAPCPAEKLRAVGHFAIYQTKPRWMSNFFIFYVFHKAAGTFGDFLRHI